MSIEGASESPELCTLLTWGGGPTTSDRRPRRLQLCMKGSRGKLEGELTDETTAVVTTL